MLYYFCCMLNQIIKFMKNFNHWNKLDKVVFLGSCFFLRVSIAMFVISFKVCFIFNALAFLVNSIIVYKDNKF